MKYRHIVAFLIVAASLIGCANAPNESLLKSTPAGVEPTQVLVTPTKTIPLTPTQMLADYKFPVTIDPADKYLFYLHGKIVEDQGIPAISPDFGPYEYEAILERLSEFDFDVISEQRPKNADSVKSARNVAAQVSSLINVGVPAKNITVVGASKGAGIAIFVSHFLENEEINYVIMAICHPDNVDDFLQNQIFLFGNVLSIFDSADDFGGSCQELFSFSDGKGISRYHEVVLNIGSGHGILYEPLDEWVMPAVQWANNNNE